MVLLEPKETDTGVGMLLWIRGWALPLDSKGGRGYGCSTCFLRRRGQRGVSGARNGGQIRKLHRGASDFIRCPMCWIFVLSKHVGLRPSHFLGKPRRELLMAGSHTRCLSTKSGGDGSSGFLGRHQITKSMGQPPPQWYKRNALHAERGEIIVECRASSGRVFESSASGDPQRGEGMESSEASNLL